MSETGDSDNSPQNDNSQIAHNLETLVGLLSSVSGLSLDDLKTAIESVSDARKEVSPPVEKSKSIYQDKELVYEDQSAFIFRRGSTKSRTFYIRIYDSKSRRPYVKSLGVTDRVAALSKARLIYQEIKGKVERGERLQALTNQQLVDMYVSQIEKTVTDIPRQGITPKTFTHKKYFLGMWLEFISSLGHERTPIDQIRPERTRGFGQWVLNRPRKDGRSEARSPEVINDAITEIKRMFQQCAVRDRFLSRDQVPEMDKLKVQPDSRYKRDILETSEYEFLMKWCWNHWCRLKDIRFDEKQKRLSFFYTLGIFYNTGLRPKELLGLRVNEISACQSDDPALLKTHLRIFIRRENSKTGRSRVVVAPVKNRVERIKAAYEAMGCPHEPTDFLCFNPRSKDRHAYSRGMVGYRLNEVLEGSGLKEELASVGKAITLYSSRHAFITWRLRFGGVPIHLLAKVAGTSVSKIENTYGHIDVEKQAAVITKNMGYFKAGGFDLHAPVEGEEES